MACPGSGRRRSGRRSGRDNDGRIWLTGGVGVRLATLGTLGVGLMLAARLGRNAGAMPTETNAALPGDTVSPDATTVTTRAIEIAAPPEQVWPWLVQMGYGRGGWYAIDALERALGVGDFLTGGSADRVVPALQDLAVGDRVPLSSELHLVVATLEVAESLVLVLPAGPLAWVWSYNLVPMHGAATAGPSGADRGSTSSASCDARGPGEAASRSGSDTEATGTRLVVRTRMGAAAGWVRPLVPILEVGHLVMELVQLHRLRRRIEVQ